MTNRFYDGRIARPSDIDIAVQAGVLVLQNKADAQQLGCWVIADMTAVDSNDLRDEMTFRHRTTPEARLILGPSAQRDLLLGQAPHLKNWRHQERLRIVKTVGGLTLGGVALVLGCYLALPRLAIALVEMMPLQWDQKLGDPIRSNIREHAHICSNTAGQRALDQLGARLMPDNIAAIPLTLDVVERDDVNAFALPGNHIVVFSGLITKAETPEMLAGVLAHEMGHLEMRHPTRGVIEQVGLGAAINLLVGNNAIGNISQMMAGLSYTRDMERQADEQAIALLHRANIRADGLAAFFELLKKDEKGSLPTLLSDHPGLEDRAAATRQDSTGGPAMSDADWQSLKAICSGS